MALVLALLCALPVQVGAQDFLAPTLDADSSDPYVVARAAELGFDPGAIFAFVRDETRHESYAGSLRGARGTLWSGAGNALDRASLLIALLRASGVPARYATGILGDAQARQQIQSMFPSPERVLGCLAPDVEVADPLNDPQLLAEARAHAWVELDTGGGFQSADPSIAGAQLGQSFATVQATFAEVPDELRHEVTVRLRRERTLPGGALLIGGALQDELVVLEQSFPTVRLVGRSLSVGHLVSAVAVSAIFTVQTNTYAPYAMVNERDGAVADDVILRGTDYQEVLTDFPFGNEVLTGLFLDVTTTTPLAGGGTSADTVTKVLLDRIGFVARQTGSAASIALPADGRPALSDVDIVTLEVGTSNQLVAPVLAQSDAVNARQAELDALVAPYPDPELAPELVRNVIASVARMLVLDSTSLVGGTVASGSDLVREDFVRVALTEAYLDSPRIVAVTNRSDPGPLPGRAAFSIDILRDRVRSHAPPFQADGASAAYRFTQGMLDSVVEAAVLEPDPVSDLVGTSSIAILVQALAQPGVRMLALEGADLGRVELLPFSAEARLRIATSLAAGRQVIVPDATASVNGADRIAWLEVDPAGHSIAVSDDGEHSSTIEYGPGIFARLHAARLQAFLALEEAEGAGAAAGSAARNPQTLRTAVCKTALFAAEGIAGVAGVEAGTNAWWMDKGCGKDPPVGTVLMSSLAPSPDFASLGGVGGVDVDAVLDPFFHVPVGGAAVPTVFRVGFKNLGASEDTFAIQPGDIPAGFSVCQSVPSLTLAPGATGEITVALLPGAAVPAAGAPAPFEVTVTSTTNPAITATSSESFSVPEIHGVVLSSAPAALATTPGAPATATITVRAAGNVAENVVFAIEAPPGLATSSLTPVALAAGETASLTLTLTPAAGTPLNTVLTATVRVDFPGALKPSEVEIPVQIVVPGAQAIADAAVAADARGDATLAGRLGDLSVVLTNLVQDPASAVFRSQALALLDSLIALLGDDPDLAGLADDLQAARDALAAASSPAEVLAAIEGLGDVLQQLAVLLTDLARHAFELALSPNTAVAQPQAPAQIGLVLRNTGTQTSTYSFAVEGLPPDVTASFTPATITLAPGDVVPRLGVPGVVLSLTPTSSAALQPVGFVVRATVQQASVQRTASGSLGVRGEVVSVVEVSPTPAFTDAGGQVAIEARVLNAVNQRRSALVAYAVEDPGGQVVATSTPQPVELELLSSVQSIGLGTLDTTGFADGGYTVEVTLTETDGTPIPGATGTGTLLIGSPVTAFMTLAPDTLPSGDGQVTSSLHLDTDVTFPAPFSLLGLVDVGDIGTSAATVALHGSYAYVCGTESIAIVDVSDPGAPEVVGNVGDGMINAAASTTCVVQDGMLYTVSTFSGGSQMVVFSLGDPLDPQQAAFLLIPYNFIGDFFVEGNNAYLSSNGVFFFLGGVNTIFRQFGDFLSIQITDFGFGVRDVVFDTTGPTLGGLSNLWQIARVSDDIAYVAGSTSQAGDTQLGSGRILVVDVSDPDDLTVLKDLAIPGTVHATGIAFQGNRALVAGSTGGWRSPFTPDFSDLEFLGTTTLTSLDITNPADPQIVGETLTTDFGPIARSGDLYATGSGVYALSGVSIDGAQSVALVDASDPDNLILSSAPIPADPGAGLLRPRGFAVSGNRFYAVTSLGLGVFEFSNVVGIPVTASVRVPKSTGVATIPGTFSTPPTEVITGPDFDTLIWKRAFAAGQTSEVISFGSRVDGLLAGEARDVTAGATVEFVAAGTPGEIELPPLTVAADNILGLTPASRTVAPGEPAAYTLRVKNPSTQTLLYDLAVQGVPVDWVTLDASVVVDAGAFVDLPLVLTADPGASLDAYGFTVTASSPLGARGAVFGELVLDGEPASTEAPVRGVVVGLTPASASAGQGTPAFFTVRVVNTGGAPATFVLDLPGLPPGIDGAFEDSSLEVPPGAASYREITLRLTPQPGAATGAVPFGVRATAANDDASQGVASGELTILAQGVDVTLDPPVGSPATTFTLTVQNTGTATDTFDLAVAGPIATSASLAETAVTLAPGASQAVALTLGPLDLALPSSVELVGSATSRAGVAARDAARAQVVIAAASGVDAMFEPPAIDLPAPGAASFLLNVQNFGNVEDAYGATIIGTSGPVTASLRGLDDQPTQQVEAFVLPGLTNGVLELAATLGGPGAGTITVRVQSLSDAALFVDATATVRTEGAATPTPTPSPTPTPTPTPVVTPTPTPSASPGLPGAFKCYSVRSKTGTPQFPQIPGVTLVDEFETLIADVVREKTLCNPVAIGAEQALDPATHRACYALRPAPGARPVVPEDAILSNRFGEQTVRFLSSSDRTLCVPAEAHLAGTEASEPLDGDALRCRRVKRIAGATLRPAPEFVLADEFETRRMRVRRVHALCTPVARDGAPILDPESALACYQVGQVPGEPAFRPPGTIEASSELGAQTLIVRNGQRMLCVPTQVGSAR